MGTTPGKIPSFTSVKAIASRGYHTLALKNDGTVWSWGRGDWGLLGDGSNQERHSPVQVVGLTGHGDVTAISGGGEVSVALMADHTLMAWGRNYKGEMGNGTVDPSDIGQWTPVSVSQTTGLTNVVSCHRLVSCGGTQVGRHRVDLGLE
jgi:alpha-tubulin suppressor-like RCC1 family protein